eukprot:4661807-Lingulodinium_polyedra.AAC.1
MRAWPPAERSPSGRYVACLATMAMGDHNAPEFGQAAHVTLGARAGALDDASLISLRRPYPRG